MKTSEALTLLAKLGPGWSLLSKSGELYDALRHQSHFRDFRGAMQFVERVAEVAEAENHHPDIKFGWGYADIRLTTHAIHGLSRNDFILAAKINQIIQELGI